MRQGTNPQKKDYKVEIQYNHRIIMVIYIPEFSGYYKAMFDVIKLSIDSLIKTIPKSSAISIVDNGSCSEVQVYLSQLIFNNKIDCLKLLTKNIGKMDALIGEARASREPIITLTDCDILFKRNWVKETINLFNKFENVASVSPIPVRKGFNYYTFSSKEAILKKKLKLKFEIIKENFTEFNIFLSSINWECEEDDCKLWPVVYSKDQKAILGSDHQVVTVRRDILFNNSPKEPSYIKVGNLSEENYLDLAIDLSGGLRLSTYNCYALHMGNKMEKWMLDLNLENEVCEENQNFDLVLRPKLNYKSKTNTWYKIKKKLIKNIFSFNIPKGYY